MTCSKCFVHCFLAFLLASPAEAFSSFGAATNIQTSYFRIDLTNFARRGTSETDPNAYPLLSVNVRINEFFKAPVSPSIRQVLTVQSDGKRNIQVGANFDFLSLLTAGPQRPGVPRPLWLVIVASVPTGLVWYGYYKFCVEEEIMAQDLAAGKQPRGFGGFGTLGPFVYGCLLGPLAFILHLPGGLQWTNLGIIFIYYTQFLLYDRVNELYREEGLEEPLPIWWCLPIFFPFDLIVGLRQVHFLSQYWYRKNGIQTPPADPVVTFFPFIGAPRFTWSEFLLTPSLWLQFLADKESIDPRKLPQPMQDFLALGERKI